MLLLLCQAPRTTQSGGCPERLCAPIHSAASKNRSTLLRFCSLHTGVEGGNVIVCRLSNSLATAVCDGDAAFASILLCTRGNHPSVRRQKAYVPSKAGFVFFKKFHFLSCDPFDKTDPRLAERGSEVCLFWECFGQNPFQAKKQCFPLNCTRMSRGWSVLLRS